MIGYLKGKAITVDSDNIVIDVNGVGYQVFCPSKAMASLVEGDTMELYINTVVKEDSITLFGFTNKEDKAWFVNLQSVQGVGPRMALAILGLMSCDDIVNAIISEDVSCFKRVSGVGPKLATRIVNELKDKKGIFNSPLPKLSEKVTGDFSTDAVSALVNLGFARKDAFFTVKNIIAENDNVGLEETIRLALSKLTG